MCTYCKRQSVYQRYSLAVCFHCTSPHVDESAATHSATLGLNYSLPARVIKLTETITTGGTRSGGVGGRGSTTHSVLVGGAG